VYNDILFRSVNCFDNMPRLRTLNNVDIPVIVRFILLLYLCEVRKYFFHTPVGELKEAGVYFLMSS
jgi:hypothetical protein